jgi:DNA-binding protein
LQKAKGDRILAAALESLERQDAAAASQGEVADDVLVKGTGKAIDKVLSVAGWLQDRAAEEGIKVRLETGSWWAVDDVEVVDNEVENGGAMDVHRKQGDEEEGVAGESDDVSDSRVRSVSVLTIRVTVL